jgi:hypothetical protein
MSTFSIKDFFTSARAKMLSFVINTDENIPAKINVDSAGAEIHMGASPGFNAAFSTLTRPANTTAYTDGDSVSNNATAGSVTALSATVASANDKPVEIQDLLLHSTDTGVIGATFRAYLYNSDPTASSGVVGGDNAAFSNKKAGFIGSLVGEFRGFSDGAVARLVPEGGGIIVTKPTSGAQTLFVQYQTLNDFTPSANSTTFIGTLRGLQGR